MVDYNLLNNLDRGKGGIQTHFVSSKGGGGGSILPYNLSISEETGKPLPEETKPHIKTYGKTYEPIAEWYLTGTLEAHARCGEIVKAIGCEDFGYDDKKHDRFLLPYRCHRPGCPECYESWALREAEKATERLFQGQTLYQYEHKRIMLRHIVFSPSPDMYRKIKHSIEQDRYNVYKREAIDIMKKAGVVGGCIVAHFWRHSKEKDDILPDNEDQDFKKPPNNDYDWYFSPHFHVIGSGFLMDSDEFYEKTGWVYKNLGERKSIKDTIFYLLTHCANHKNHHALTWFGNFSYDKIRIDYEETRFETVKCQCGKDLYKYAMDYSWDKLDTKVPDWDNQLDIYYRKIKIRIYKLSERGKCLIK